MIVELLTLIMFLLAVGTVNQFLILWQLRLMGEAQRDEEDDYYEDGDTPPEFEEAMVRLQPMELPILGTPDSDEEERLHVV